MGIALLSGPQDPSQLDAVVNQLIENINAYLAGTGGSVITVPVSAASTATSISPTSGQVTVNTTTRTAGTTGRYTVTAPSAAGQVLKITSLSTVQATITGAFSRSRLKVTMKTTAALTSAAKLPSMILTALSTSQWMVSASYGNVAAST